MKRSSFHLSVYSTIAMIVPFKLHTFFYYIILQERKFKMIEQIIFIVLLACKTMIQSEIVAATATDHYIMYGVRIFIYLFIFQFIFTNVYQQLNIEKSFSIKTNVCMCGMLWRYINNKIHPAYIVCDYRLSDLLYFNFGKHYFIISFKIYSI